MPNEKFVIRCNQQDRKRSFAPLGPYAITYFVAKSKSFRQANMVDLRYCRFRLTDII